MDGLGIDRHRRRPLELGYRGARGLAPLLPVLGTRVALGKEWWVAPHWGIGLQSWFAFSFNREGAGLPTWKTYTGGLSFSATIN